ncbi:hypothetical protein QN277_022055 [Acacia crassicarpa]|uniref:Mechanosensitive ion channel MscS domain-containing protein n=1 Tax=Acacia crassicarpa TaxID=499986 RepID=A0AAE1JE99_9FABA|nr:hypothetical protein QN277_022055 [Acacia crassicarpa]
MSPARVRFSCLKRLQKFSANCCLNLKSTQPIKHHILNLTRRNDFFHVKLPINLLSQSYFKGELQLPAIFAKKQFRTQTSENSNLLNTKPTASLSPNISRFCLHRKSLPFASMTLTLKHRSYSSYLSDSTDIGDWAADLTPCVQQLLDSNPFLVISVGSTLIAWIVMPLILRKLHQYSMQSSAATTLPYEKTFWVALEDPVRYLVTFVAFSHICVTIAPTSEASQHLAESWKEAVILVFTWFLHRWKTNILGHISSHQSYPGQDQHKLLNLQNVSSASVFGIGGTMALTQAGAVSVESVVIFGGMGGAATAFAASDVLANVFSGLCMQLSEPFTIGDTIKAGWVEGQVIEMGVTKTSLMNGEKMEVIVPNSHFTKQAIVIKSRAEWRGTISKIRVRIEAIDRIGKISQEMKSMLTANGNVLLGKRAPYCYLSRIGNSHAEVTLGYDLKLMGNEAMCSAKQGIMKEAMEILRRHNAAHLSSDSDSDSDSD